jgi:hypothetical protein
MECVERKGYWINELRSLGINPNNESREKDYTLTEDMDELMSHVETIKQTFCQEYKTAYSERMIDLEQNEQIAVI